MLDITKTLLKNLGAGDLQNLAQELLPNLYLDWEIPLIHNGICEGGNRTRKGTPDIWGERKNSTLVFIQATADHAKGKMFGDLKKSVDELIKIGRNQGALCIAFLSYEPHPGEVTQCEEYCNSNSCVFEFYSNGKVSELLDQKFNQLRNKYLGLKTSYYFLAENTDGEPPQTCNKLATTMEWNLNEQELSSTAEDFMMFYSRLFELPKLSREFYCKILEKSEQGYKEELMEVLAQEIEQVLSMSEGEIIRVMQILEKYGFGHIDHDEWENKTMLVIRVPNISWPILSTIKQFSYKQNISLESLIIDLKFNQLD